MLIALLLAAAAPTAPITVYRKSGSEAPAPQRSPQGGLPRFEFRSVHAGDPMPRRGPFGCPTTKSGDRMCLEADFQVAGVQASRAATVYNSSGLTALMFSVSRSDAPTLLSALQVKYGKPCKTDTASVQNGYGATFQRDSFQWCFSDGVAIFRSLGSKIDEADFYFTTEVDQPKGAIIDF